ncbi:MAG: hypothetical protein ACTSX8_05060 [Alphaproteobacteria bacterium]
MTANKPTPTIVTRDQVARALRELETAAREFQTLAFAVEPSDTAGAAKHMVKIGNADALLTSTIGEAQALLRQLDQDDQDRADVQSAINAMMGEGTSRQGGRASEGN